MIPPRLFLFLSSILSAMFGVSAWSSSHLMGRSFVGQSFFNYVPRSSSFLANKSDDTDLVKDNTEKESSAAYGVSFIGGDPCGSKYNDDPFDATKEEAFKPGFPDDMKARIEALAAKKLQEQKND
ncbi:hypothetical protein ACHAWT_006613 [Skeletonema menzelii]|mmetsp:Transcript_24807/g.40938  ORF Transcript_24807/g.40938 Transcript_24807/m.40938 type:complete len:125 (+) Transcript_24807:256-630(+)|eukprot:scaffold5772_cov145-Skeletonema_menzelii.AAC.3